MFHQGIMDLGKVHQRMSKQGNIIRFVVFILLTLATIWRMERKVVRLEHSNGIEKKSKKRG